MHAENPGGQPSTRANDLQMVCRAMSFGEGLEEELSLRMSLSEPSLADYVLSASVEDDQLDLVEDRTALKPLTPSFTNTEGPGPTIPAKSAPSGADAVQSFSPSRSRKKAFGNAISSNVSAPGSLERTKEASASDQAVKNSGKAGKENFSSETPDVSDEDLFRATKQLVIKQGKDNAMTVI